MAKIFFISGVSGAGKGSLIRNIKSLENPDIIFPLSYKTRTPRPGEVHGVDAYFLTREQFFADIKAGEFLEYAFIHDTDYGGTKKKDIFAYEDDDEKKIIKEVDMIGLEKLVKEYPELRSKMRTIFLNIPSELLPERIKQRGENISQKELKKRLTSADSEREKAQELCDYIIDATQDPTDVLSEVMKILYKEYI